MAWRKPPHSFHLSEAEVHVWRTELDPPAEDVERHEQTLTPDELARADRFYFPRDRRQFIVARGVLRALLGAYLGIPPDQVRFRYAPQGKPALDTDAMEMGGRLQFNLSHSGTLALFAFVRRRQIGVDLESVHREVSVDQISNRFFTPREITALRSLPEDDRREAFFRAWTRKEAYIKARGEGLSLGLDQIDVSPALGEPTEFVRLPDLSGGAEGWSLHDLQPGPGYIGALAVEGRRLNVNRFHFTKS
jgi:4'-phosphopantetheinyl transferase